MVQAARDDAIHTPSAERPRVKLPLDEFKHVSRSFFIVPQAIRRYQATREPRNLERFIDALRHNAAAPFPSPAGASMPSAGVVPVPYLLPEDTGIPYNYLLDLLSNHGFSDPQRKGCGSDFTEAERTIQAWVDDGLLYLHAQPDGWRVVQLARPSDAEYYYPPGVTADELLRLHSVFAQAHRPNRFADFDALQRLMEPRIHQLLQWPHARSGILVVMGSGCEVCDEAGAYQTIDAGSISAVLGDRTLSWERYYGIDAVRCTVTPGGDTPATLTISGWQCKNGRMDGTLL